MLAAALSLFVATPFAAADSRAQPGKADRNTSPAGPSAECRAGSAAMIAGDFELAARLLEKPHGFESGHRDPELHYLRGEALYVLGRRDEAYAEHGVAEQEIGLAPEGRGEKLWLARIYARRGQLDRADEIYRWLWPSPGQPLDPEVSLNHAEGHLLNKDWAGAEKLLRRFLEDAPDHLRAREMLAWALEAQGNLDAELAVRSTIAKDHSSVSSQQSLGRVFERVRDYNQAYAAYETAATSSIGASAELLAARDRMRFRTTPEVAAGVMLRSDPAVSSQHLRAGVALPFGSRHVMSLLGWHESMRSSWPAAAEGTVSAIGGSVQLGTRLGTTLLVGGALHGVGQVPSSGGARLQNAEGLKVGGVSEVNAPLGRRIVLNLRGEASNPWMEAPVGLLNGGTVSSAAARVYALPLRSGRVIIDSGVQGRRLGLAAAPAGGRPEASQLLLWTGADVVLRHDPTRTMNGEILDDNLVNPAGLADSVIVSLRHYELFGQTNLDFKSRIPLLDRAGYDNVSLVIRDAFLGGKVGVDMRAGIGYERVYGRLLSQAGLSLLAAPTRGSRLGLSYDIAQETMTGLVGTRHTGWLMYHADL